IAAFYVGPAPIPHDELSAFAAERLARYKCPRIFHHIEALPRSANGKVIRKALREYTFARRQT
ncbi:MAG: benzoate--CoA ligase, partial [Pseudomonadota bacterium]